jgi:two-component system KDP operon response regulator KdpE
MSEAEPGPHLPMVLIVEDEPQMLRFLRPVLGSLGYELVEATTGADALRLAATRTPDLVLLDLGLPDLDGLEVTRRLREWSQVPIIVVSARGKETDKIAVLDAGADDYVTKPFGVGELLARVRVALRHAARSGDSGAPLITIDELTVDLDKRRVALAGREVRLTPTEYRLVALLAKHAGRVLTHSFLLREVWGSAYAGQTHYLRVYMAQLRRKLERDPAQPFYLLTEPGVGYRMREEP